MDLTPSQLGIEQVAKQQAQASLEDLNLNWSDWSVLFYLFFLIFDDKVTETPTKKKHVGAS